MSKKLSLFFAFFAFIFFVIAFFPPQSAIAQKTCTTPDGKDCKSVGGVCDGTGYCYYNGMICGSGCSNPYDQNRCQTSGNPTYDNCSTLYSGDGAQSWCCYNAAPTPPPPPPQPIPPPPTDS